MVEIFVYLTYEQYKEFEKQMVAGLERTHTIEGGYYKSYRLTVGDIVLEVCAPLIKIAK